MTSTTISGVCMNMDIDLEHWISQTCLFLVLQLLTFRDFLSLGLLLEYLIEHVASEPLYVYFVFSTKILYRGIQALQRIGAVDQPPASCMLVHFLEI